MFQNKNSILIFKVFLILFLLIEIGFHTFWKNLCGPYISPLISIISGVLFCLFALFICGFQKNSFSYPKLSFNKRIPQIIAFSIVFIIFTYWCGNFMNKIFSRIPIDPKLSDIIPSLQIYVNRLINLQTVYLPLQFDGYAVNPTYFPLLWFPYLFSEILNIDYRWTPYFFFLISIFIFLILLIKANVHFIEILIKIFIPFLWIYLFTQFDAGTIGMTVELLPIAFYFLLSLSLFRNSPWIIAFGILICLLSRYAFTFWLPVYLITIWIEFDFSKVFKSSIIIFVGVILIYILPFLSNDWTAFSKGFKYYDATTISQWEMTNSDLIEGKPYHLTQGLGLALYFYDFNVESFSIEQRLHRNKFYHILICFFTALFVFFYYFIFRKRGLNIKFYFLVALKFYLIIFYGFFYMPFSYLFQLPLFLSIPILFYIPFKNNILNS